MRDLSATLHNLKKTLSKKEVYLLFFLLFIFFLTRLINLKMIPIFVDEGGYIFWAKQAFIKAQFYQSVFDGKPPLNVWGISLLLNLFPSDPLFAGRFFSIITGFIAACGFFILACSLFNKKTAFVSTLLYIFIPFILFYDRLAVVESMVNMIFIWMFIFSIILIKRANFVNTISLGIVSGLGLLTKGNVWLFIYFFILSPLLVFKDRVKLIENVKFSVNFFPYYMVSILVALGLYDLVLSPLPKAQELISSKSQGFLYSISEMLNNPVRFLQDNVLPRTTMLLHMTGWITIIFTACGLFYLYRKRKHQALYLFLWLVGSLFIITYSVKHFFPRYLIFLPTIMILLSGYFLSTIKRLKISYFLLALLLIVFFYFDYSIMFDYHKLDFPRKERQQYVEDISSGHGIKEIVNYAKEYASNKPVVILSEGIFGIGSNLIDATIGVNEKNIQVVGSWPLTKEVLISYQQLIPKKYVFVVLNYRDESKVPHDWPIKFVRSYKKPYNYPYFSLYSLTE